MKPDLIDRAQLVTDLENFKFSLGSVFFMAVVDRVIERVQSQPTYEDPDPNPYWANVCGIADQQRAKGLATYGQGIEANPAEMATRLVHLQEELVDALMYCEWIKDGVLGTTAQIEPGG